MSPLAKRLADIGEQLNHLRELGEQVERTEVLRSYLGLRNDVLFALLV